MIGCSDYSELRKMEGMQGFSDIPESLEDIKVVYAGLRRLRFKREEITMLIDGVYMEVKMAIDQAMNAIYENHCNGQNTLLFVYYAGHGVMDNYTYSVLNGGRRYKYPLER